MDGGTCGDDNGEVSVCGGGEGYSCSSAHWS